MELIKCTHCDYESMCYSSDEYKYKGIPKIWGYPSIYTGWCAKCKAFVPVIKGVNLRQIQEEKNKTETSIIGRCNKFFNLFGNSNDVERLLNKMEALSIIEYEISGQDTVDTCAKCGSNNIIRKDISKPTWACPNCNIGLLQLTASDTKLRIVPREIPFPKCFNKEFPLIVRIISCANEIIKNEFTYLGINKKVAAMQKLIENDDYCILDRVSLVCSYLSHFYEKQIPEVLLEYVARRMHSENIISKDIEAQGRLIVMMRYFNKEIEIEKGCTYFMPAAIISTLRNPDRTPTHKINGCDAMDAIMNWGVIKETIEAFFYYFK